MTQRALTLARASFPKAELLSACERVAGHPRIQLKSFDLKHENVHFHVNEPVVPASGVKWALSGLSDLAELSAQLRANPLLRSVVDDNRPLWCVVQTMPDGQTARLVCGREQGATAGWGKLELDHQRVQFAFTLDETGTACCPRFRLDGFSMPLERLNDDEPGWCQVKMRPDVARFRENHSIQQVIIDRTATLRANDGAELRVMIDLPGGTCAACAGLPRCVTAPPGAPGTKPF
jgi:hypothetical protein